MAHQACLLKGNQNANLQAILEEAHEESNAKFHQKRTTSLS
jgi:hypothetical protein